MAKKPAIVMTTTSRFWTWVSSWAITPSSSAGDSSSMIPVVAHTVAFLGERPIANAFGMRVLSDGDARLRQVGLHAQALDHRVQLRRLLWRDDARAHGGERELVGGEELEGGEAAGDQRRSRWRRPPRREQRRHEHGVDEAEQEHRDDHPDLEPGVAAE